MSSILDRSKYDQSTLLMLDSISSFFIDMYYNNLYQEAIKSRQQGKSISNTASYKEVLSCIRQSFNEGDHLKKYLSSLHNYYNMYNVSTTYIEFVDRVIREFVPESYFPLLSNANKAISICTVIKDANYKLIDRIISKYLKHIIDNRSIENAEIIKDELINIFLIERDLLSSKFKAEERGKGESDKTITINKLEADIYKLLKEKCEMAAKEKVMKVIIHSKAKEINQLKEENATLKRELDKRKDIIVAKSPIRKSSSNNVIEPIDDFDSASFFTKRPKLTYDFEKQENKEKEDVKKEPLKSTNEEKIEKSEKDEKDAKAYRDFMTDISEIM
jgi:hypothetical protein